MTGARLGRGPRGRAGRGPRKTLPGTVAVVMTMGALHDGPPRADAGRPRQHADHVIVTIFVNPLQFGPNEDFDRYPRTLEADLEICRAEGVDVVFAPDLDGDVSGRRCRRSGSRRARSARSSRAPAGPATSPAC